MLNHKKLIHLAKSIESTESEYISFELAFLKLYALVFGIDQNEFQIEDLEDIQLPNHFIFKKSIISVTRSISTIDI